MDRVAVIIAAFNVQETIARCVLSALCDPAVSEIVVVDDCSEDDTVTAALNCDDGSGRLRVLRQDRNMGPATSRNKAIAGTTSNWIALLDADDFFLPGRISRLLTHSARYDLIADDVYQVYEHNPDGPRETLMRPPIMDVEDITFLDFVAGNLPHGTRQRGELGFIKPLIRRAFLHEHNITYNETIRLGEDFELYARLLAYRARMCLIPAQGYVYVRRENSLSGQHAIEDLLRLRDCNTTLLKDFADRLGVAEKKALKAHYVSIDCRYQWRILIHRFKERDVAGFVKTFFISFPVSGYLFKKLVEQAYIRSVRKIKQSCRIEHYVP